MEKTQPKPQRKNTGIKHTGDEQKLWHTAQVFRLPDDHTLKDLNNTFYDYIWNNTKTRINKRQLQQPRKEGGL